MSGGDRFDAIVVGAGYGGVTAAARLADAGLKVLLVDKNARPGGKAMRAPRADGADSELWPVAGGPTRGSRFDDLVRLVGLGDDIRIEADPVTDFIYLAPDGRRRVLRVAARPIRNPLTMLKLASALGVAPWRLGAVVRMHLEGMLAAGPLKRRYGRVGMLDWLARCGAPPPLRDWIASMMNLFFVVPVDELPVSEAAATLRDVARGGAGRYYRGGYGVVAEAAVAFVERCGGTWLPRTRVERIVVAGGCVTGVEAAGRTWHAPVVLSNAGIQPTLLGLLPPRTLPRHVEDHARALQPSLAFVGLRLELAQPVFTTPMTVVFSPTAWWDRRRYEAAAAGDFGAEPLVFVTVPALYDPQLAPAGGGQLALTGILCSPQPDHPMQAQAIATLERMLAQVWPQLPGLVRRRQAYGAAEVARTTRDAVVPGQGGECIGLAQVIGQCGADKPDVRGPLPGLYFVGCDAGGRGIGTTQAVDSGWNAAAAVIAAWRLGLSQRPSGPGG